MTIIYYGNGKGKTTAAMGVVMRAAGSGLNVKILQFIKGEWPSGERDFIKIFSQMKVPKNKKLGKIEIETTGRGFVKILGDKKPISDHKQAAAMGLQKAKEVLRSKKYEVVLLDEIISAYEEKLIKVKDIEEVIAAKPEGVHLIMTGHVLPKSLKHKADLVTEMKMIKHPYYKGILAQRGIDF